MLELIALVAIGAVIIGAIAFVGLMLKLLFKIALIPVWIVFGVLKFVLALVVGVVLAVLGLVLLPVAAILFFFVVLPFLAISAILGLFGIGATVAAA